MVFLISVLYFFLYPFFTYADSHTGLRVSPVSSKEKPFGTLDSYPYEFAIASCFRDEAPYLKEWIEYHRLLGFSHFWLYNNNSSDHFQEVLAPYVKDQVVELIDWPSPPGSFWVGYQVNAFNDAIAKAKGKAKWLALIDIDEFIVPLFGKESFKEIMQEMEQNSRLGGLVLFWQVFGTSDYLEVPPDKTLIETLTRRAPSDFPLNHFIKSIVRPERVEYFDIHSGLYKPPFENFTLEGPAPSRKMSLDQPIIASPIRINHYWVRTLRWLYEVKIPRLKFFNSSTFEEEEVKIMNSQLNQEEDKVILQYLPELKRKLGYNF